MYNSSYAGRPRRSSSTGGQSRRNYGGGNRNRPRRSNSQRIDPARFIKAAKTVEQIEYTPVNSFEDFALEKILKNNLRAKNFEHPTQIQDQAIPEVLEGKDVVGIANTGTGKTAAFMLPTLNKLITNRGEKVIIIAPTRELAIQIQTESRDFAKGCRLWDVLLIGGAPIGRQLRDLKKDPEIVIGTPGRIKDHIERRTLDLSNVSTVVLDEVDRMLDMGFINDIRSILSELPEKRQSLFFSATMDRTIEGLIQTFTKSPITIMSKTSETSDNVDQSVMHYSHDSEKLDKLHDVLKYDNAHKILVFSETRRSVERLSKELNSRGFSTDAMHGNKSQGQRQRALRNFKENHVNVLVATDVAARGIDVDGISHVINYDIPQTYDDYTHRIGRTGRSGNLGFAITFVKK